MSLPAEPTAVDLEELARRIESSAGAGERLQLLDAAFTGRLAASTSFGAQSPVMLHLLSQYAPGIPIVFIDTGYLFPETYQFAERLIRILNLDVRVFHPRMTAARQEALYGRLWEQGAGGLEKYGLLNKVEPMNRALRELGADAWISGVRRSQSRSREQRDFVERQKRTAKLYPILDWTDQDVERYFLKHDLPRHPLTFRGYVSIGDWHSSKPLVEGDAPEETRFDGMQRECGLHLPSAQQDYQI